MIATSSVLLSVLCFSVTVATERSERATPEEWTNPLFATEMYAKYSASMEKELVAAGRPAGQADYLVFHVTAEIARCATVRLSESEDPKVERFLRLLDEEETYSRVIDRVSDRYASREFWDLMASVDQATAACFEESFRRLGLFPE